MIYQEIHGDVTKAPEDHYIMHCISSDFALGAGVARAIDNTFLTRTLLFQKYSHKRFSYPQCLIAGRVINLVTKHMCYHKPTYDSLKVSLEMAKKQSLLLNIKKIALPQIGSGLDKLSWNKVRQILKDTFADIDIELTVYVY